MRLTLRTADQTLPLAQVGPSWLRFSQPVSLTPGPATLEIEVDGHRDCTAIQIEPHDTPAERFDYDLA